MKTRTRPAAVRGIGPKLLPDGRPEIHPEQLVRAFTPKPNPALSVLIGVEKELKLEREQVRLLATLAQIFKRDHGITTPVEHFISELIALYQKRDEQGAAINDGEIEDLVKQLMDANSVMFMDAQAWIFRNRDLMAVSDGSFVAAW